MTSLVPSIVEVLMNKIALWISNRGNDWTAESAIIASNGLYGTLLAPLTQGSNTTFYKILLNSAEFYRISLGKTRLR